MSGPRCTPESLEKFLRIKVEVPVVVEKIVKNQSLEYPADRFEVKNHLKNG